MLMTSLDVCIISSLFRSRLCISSLILLNSLLSSMRIKVEVLFIKFSEKFKYQYKPWKLMATPFRQVIDFFEEIGLYDVVMPFLLVFTIVFAILEKTKVLGTEEIEGKKYTKKNLNAIASFVIAFLVIAAKELVQIINETVAKAVIVLFFSILFLLLVGSFHKEGEPIYLQGGWKIAFEIIVFLAITGIFLDSIKTSDGRTWLQRLGDFTGSGNDQLAGSLILMAIIVLFIVYAVKEPSKSSSGSSGGH